MNHQKALRLIPFVLVFFLGAAVGGFAAKKQPVKSSAWEGQAPEQAAENLMEHGWIFAEKGSWENIYAARVQYLAGDEEAAEEVFRRYAEASKPDASDVMRIGRVYAEAGDWDKAKKHFDHVVELTPKDEDWLAEIGAWYNLNGDREYAEELFSRSVDLDGKNLGNTLSMAGSYIGVRPRR